MQAEAQRDFVQLYTSNERELFRYTLSLCPNETEARDILQEASLALWKKFDQYDRTRPFVAWAFRFIRTQVRKHREKQSVQRKYFCNEVLESLADLRCQHNDHLKLRTQALEHCVTKMSLHQMTLLKMRYEERSNLSAIAESMKNTRDALYKTLERTRKQLHRCITQHLNNESI